MPPKQTKVVASRKTVMPISRAGRAQIRRKDSNTQNNMNDQGMEDEEIDQQREGMKNQYEQLTAQELNEDMPSKMLEPKNPQAPKNITVYDYYTRKFKTDELVDQMIVHFSMDGDYIWKESNEYKTQEEIRDTKKALIKEAMRKQESEEPGANHDEEAIKQTLRNKFNYNTRECQTINPSIRERGVSTEPPPSDTICGNITQWEIFDAYYAEIMKDHQIENKKKKEVDQDKKQDQSMYSTSFKRCCKIMERMVVQNDQEDKYHDYRYYWSQGDNLEAGKNEGHLLPIWRFSNEKQRKKNVTSICWNPLYPDLFAVSLGSYDFTKQRMGLICLYSLKNTTHPEYAFNCEAGVMCLDFHPKSAALLAVGLYDGTVLVYDIRNKHKKPIYQSTVRNQKHTDPVWQVKWNPDTSKNYNFYSISSDGRVMNWILMKNKLEPEEVILLRLVGKNEEESTLIGLACGLCFDFNKFEPHIFLVGTEEGKIHKCSRAYSGQYQETYNGHLLAVYKVKWNNFHPRTFISASADWTVRIWDSKYTSQIICFDLSMMVVDAVWAPYSSTVFACATMDKVQVYDLNVDKLNKLAEQKIVKQPKLTNLSFNYKDPILLVGDSHGGVTLVKLSPNLCKSGPEIKQTEDKKAMEEFKNVKIEDYEREKMENLLA
nr:Chain D, Dynein intermediate chain 2 [Tetrahymena thermophila]